MAGQWKPIPFSEKLFTNVAEAVLTKASAAIENAFVNEAGGHSRFPGLLQRYDFGGAGRTYLDEYRGDLVAVCGGQMHLIDQDLNVTNVTAIPVAGSGRAIFAHTPDELIMAAGREIVRFAGGQTELLSEDAPLASHVGYIDGFLVGNETESGRFFNSAYGESRAWDPLDVFAANGSPDNITAMAVSPYRELLVAGPKSIEQYEPRTSGDVPFFRRWSVGEGISAPYTLLSDKDGNWGINEKLEFVRFTGQISRSVSDEIGLTFEGVDDWTDAWTAQMNIRGQKFIVLQIPKATNPYGTQGITALYDFRQGRWANLYGWDADLQLPARWPGWSYFSLWGRHWVGGEGKLYELVHGTWANGGQTQRMLGRTAHIDSFGEVSIDNIRMRVKRGVGTQSLNPQISMRVLRDNKTWTRWVRKGLGKPGERDMFIDFGPMGSCSSFQIEWEVTDACEVEIVRLEGQFSRLGD